MPTDEDVDDELVEAYWRHHRLSCGERADRLAAKDLFWAWEEVDAVMQAGGVEAVQLLIALAAAVEGDDGALCYLGAGTIESLLRDYGPPSKHVVAALDRAAEESVSVRTAVRCVWWSADDDPELVARFRRFGDPF